MVDTIPQNGHGGSVDLNIEGKVAVVTLRRGENQFNFEMFEAYNKVLDEIERNPDVAVLVTTSEGKFFSNGLDLQFMGAALQIDPELVSKLMVEFYRLLSRILTFPMPTIAAINGHAFAGGVFLSMAHDYRIMQTGRGWMCLNEVFINMRVTPFLYALCKTKFTPAQLQAALVFGTRFTAEKAQAIGIVEQVASPGKLMKVTRKFVSGFLSSPYKRESLHNMKSDMYHGIISLKNNISSTVTAKL